MRSKPAAFELFRREEAGVFLIQFKQKRDALGFVFEIGFAVGGIDGVVKLIFSSFPAVAAGCFQ